MEFIRYNPALAEPLPGSKGVNYIAVRAGGRMAAMLLRFDARGDTGKRAVGTDIILSVVSGSGTVRSGSTVADVKVGDVLILPGGGLQHHIWTNADRFEVILLTVPSK